MQLNDFYEQIKNNDSLSPGDTVPYFVYYINKYKKSSANAADIRNCFSELNLAEYSNIPAHFAMKLKRKLYIKDKSGYKLARSCIAKIEEQLVTPNGFKKATQEHLSALLELTTGDRRKFLEEAVSCYDKDLHRSAVVMTWLFVVDYLYDLVLTKHLDDFNTALQKNPDKKVKVITQKDDFSDLKESRFIELCRSANIINGNVKNLLDSKLDTRNSASHPNDFKITHIGCADFITSLIRNVVEKYPI